jgi:hypothetical protein
MLHYIATYLRVDYQYVRHAKYRSAVTISFTPFMQLFDSYEMDHMQTFVRGNGILQEQIKADKYRYVFFIMKPSGEHVVHVVGHSASRSRRCSNMY